MNRILSFDVGIINLAYCIIDKKEEDYEIKKWGIINIDNTKLTCKYINKNKKVCGKNAKFILNDSHLCKLHSKKHMIDETKIIKEQEGKCCFEKKLKSGLVLCGQASSKQIDNKNYCDKHFEKAKKDYIKQVQPKKIPSQNSNHRPIDQLTKHMYTQFDENKEFLEVDEVLIENQPSLINPTMKTISALIYGYFTMRGVVDKDKTKSKISNIRFISPSNKLKINKETTDKTLEKAKTKREEYMMTKDLGKKYCKALIEEDKKHLQFVESVSKHDDLCDAFLQGFYYLFINNMPDKYINILNSISKKIESKEKKGIKIKI